MKTTSPVSPTELVQELAAKMRARGLEADPSNRSWTAELKDALHQMFEAESTDGTEVLCTHTERARHEFLLDVVVWNRKDGEGVILAVESEWTQHVADIEEDFWKLLVVKSPVKLMVFATSAKPRKHTQDVIWQKLGDCLLKYRDHVAGEQYVFVDFAPASARKAWWIEVPSNGVLAGVPPRQWIAMEQSGSPMLAKS